MTTNTSNKTNNDNQPLWDRAVIKDIMDEKDRETKYKKLDQYAKDCIGEDLLEEFYLYYSPVHPRLKDGELGVSLAQFSNPFGAFISPPDGVELADFIRNLLNFMKTENILIRRMLYTYRSYGQQGIRKDALDVTNTRDGYVILGIRQLNAEKYVTGWLSVNKNTRELDSLTHENYHSDYFDALTDFKMRVTKGH